MLSRVPEVEYYATSIESQKPRICRNVIQENERTDFAQTIVQLEKHTPPDRKLAIIHQLRGNLSPLPGARVKSRILSRAARAGAHRDPVAQAITWTPCGRGPTARRSHAQAGGRYPLRQ